MNAPGVRQSVLGTKNSSGTSARWASKCNLRKALSKASTNSENVVQPKGGPFIPKMALSTASMSCLCSPTNHPGSFRCRLHRATRTSSSALSALHPIITTVTTSMKDLPRQSTASPEAPPSPHPLGNLPHVDKKIVIMRALLGAPKRQSSRKFEARPSRLSRVVMADAAAQDTS